MFSVPTKTLWVREKAGGRNDPLVVPCGDLSDKGAVSEVAKAFADAQRQVVVDGNKSGVEETLERGGETKTIGRVGAAAFVHAPRDDVPSNKALWDWKPCDAASGVVATEHGVTEE